MKLRKLIDTVVMAALFFWTPSFLPARAGINGCGLVPTGWLTADTAFAGITVPLIPCPTPSSPTPWPVIILGAGVVSLILSAAIVSQAQCRELTQQEAFTSLFLPFFGIALNQHNDHCHHKHNH